MKTLIAVLAVLSTSSVFAAPKAPPKMLVFKNGKAVTPMNVYNQNRVPLNYYDQARPRVRPWDNSTQLKNGTILP